jgi:glycerate 2-kinase
MPAGTGASRSEDRAIGRIQNLAALTGHGDRELRRDALEIAEHALAAADPGKALRAQTSWDGRRFTVAGRRVDLRHAPRVLVLGAGKASYAIAQGLETMLGARIDDGLVVLKHGQPASLERIRLAWGGHPIPDEAGADAARAVAQLARTSGPGDVVFACITGGSSALLPMPIDRISLADKQAVNRVLLACGADIRQVNSVRKHLSRIKGGRLAEMLHPEAVVVNLTVSDVTGDPLDYITDPTVPDSSTLADARATLDRYDLWQRLPGSVTDFLRRAGPDQETPKAFPGRDIVNVILVPGDSAVRAAMAKARDMGFAAHLLAADLTGDSAAAAARFMAFAGDLGPVAGPTAIVAGGETTVTIPGEAGRGGPNQTFALAAALLIGGRSRACVLGLDTDGTDGPTDMAGGLVDYLTAEAARQAGIDIAGYLARYDASTALARLDDAVLTGATGTNVNDLKLLLLMPSL